ncbi:hypothetical protein EG329_012259 [Mollisiaceae sp. DMI_Dod_QoI]|nr:hypothetical protein EG329_012259 [Helotiales sp. DMI_Dod_QoI]
MLRLKSAFRRGDESPKKTVRFAAEPPKPLHLGRKILALSGFGFRRRAAIRRELHGRWSHEPELVATEDSRTSQTRSAIQHFLYAHGDTPQSLETTKRVFDELLTDFITEICFEAHRSASLSGRQKIKLDDIKFACRKNPMYLGKIEETIQKKVEIEAARKLLDQNDDKITKSNVKALEEEPLGDADDDMDLDTKTIGGKSTGTGAGR